MIQVLKVVENLVNKDSKQNSYPVHRVLSSSFWTHFAQQESQSLSQNVKLGFRYRYQQGQITVNHNRFLGFTKDENGQLIVDPDEAVVIRRIFREYLEGASLQQIGRGLEADGILTGAGKTKWRAETLQKELLKVANAKGDYDSIADEIYRLREARQSAMVDNAEREGVKQRISEMQGVNCYKKFISSLCGHIVLLRIMRYNKLSYLC